MIKPCERANSVGWFGVVVVAKKVWSMTWGIWSSDNWIGLKEESQKNNPRSQCKVKRKPSRLKSYQKKENQAALTWHSSVNPAEYATSWLISWSIVLSTVGNNKYSQIVARTSGSSLLVCDENPPAHRWPREVQPGNPEAAWYRLRRKKNTRYKDIHHLVRLSIDSFPSELNLELVDVSRPNAFDCRRLPKPRPEPHVFWLFTG